MRAAILILGVACTAGGWTVAAQKAATAAPPTLYGYTVVRSYPHDPQAFTQGLEYVDGVLYESTGLNGRSGIRKVHLASGRSAAGAAARRAALRRGHHGLEEPHRPADLAVRARVRLRPPDASSSSGRSRYTGEGWGLTHDGTRLIMSDGSASGSLRLLDPETLKQIGTLIVRTAARPVAQAQRAGVRERARSTPTSGRPSGSPMISPKTGRVTGWIDLHGLLDPRESGGRRRAQRHRLRRRRRSPLRHRQAVAAHLRDPADPEAAVTR